LKRSQILFLLRNGSGAQENEKPDTRRIFMRQERSLCLAILVK